MACYNMIKKWFVVAWNKRRQHLKMIIIIFFICSQLREDIKCVLSLRSITTSIMEICKKCASLDQGSTNIQ